MPVRESLSSLKHLERLVSARQYGTYRSSPGSSGGGGAPGGAGPLCQQRSDAAAALAKETVPRLSSVRQSLSSIPGGSRCEVESRMCEVGDVGVCVGGGIV